MKKEELESILGRGRPGFDLGPIEDQLHDIEDRFKRAGLCLKRWNGAAMQGILTRKIGNRPCLKRPGSTSCRA